MHSNALRYTRESRTIVFDNKGNISKVISDNSRIYNGEPTERPLGIKSNNYCFKPIYDRRNHLLEYLANSRELEPTKHPQTL